LASLPDQPKKVELSWLADQPSKMKEVTDPELLRQLEGESHGKEVTDPVLLAQLEGKAGPSKKDYDYAERLFSEEPTEEMNYRSRKSFFQKPFPIFQNQVGNISRHFSILQPIRTFLRSLK